VSPAYLVVNKPFDIKVLDLNATPVVSATVTYATQSKQTDPNGVVSFSTIAKNGVVSVSKEGYSSTSIRLILRSSGSADSNNVTVSGQLAVSIPDGNIFVGEAFDILVSDFNGEPIENATIRYGSQTVLTSADGTASLTAVRNVTRITVSKNQLSSSLIIRPMSVPTSPGAEDECPDCNSSINVLGFFIPVNFLGFDIAFWLGGAAVVMVFGLLFSRFVLAPKSPDS